MAGLILNLRRHKVEAILTDGKRETFWIPVTDAVPTWEAAREVVARKSFVAKVETRNAMRIERYVDEKNGEQWLVYCCPTKRTKKLIAIAPTLADAKNMIVPGWPVEIFEVDGRVVVL